MNKYLLILAAPLAFQATLLGGPKEDLQAALQKLRDASNYTWVSKTEVEGSRFPGGNAGTVTGKAEKGGFALITQSTDDQSIQVVQKGEKAALKSDNDWKLASELPEIARGGGGGAPDPSMRANLMGRRLLTTKRPGDEAESLVGKVKEIKAVDGTLTGELTPEAAKELATMGRGRGGGGGGGGAAREAKDAKGNVTWWLNDGNVSKIQLKVSGKFTNRDGEESEIKRTTITEFKDIGATKLEVPEAAKKKLN